MTRNRPERRHGSPGASRAARAARILFQIKEMIKFAILVIKIEKNGQARQKVPKGPETVGERSGSARGALGERSGSPSGPFRAAPSPRPPKKMLFFARNANLKPFLDKKLKNAGKCF